MKIEDYEVLFSKHVKKLLMHLAKEQKNDAANVDKLLNQDFENALRDPEVIRCFQKITPEKEAKLTLNILEDDNIREDLRNRIFNIIEREFFEAIYRNGIHVNSHLWGIIQGKSLDCASDSGDFDRVKSIITSCKNVVRGLSETKHNKVYLGERALSVRDFLNGKLQTTYEYYLGHWLQDQNLETSSLPFCTALDRLIDFTGFALDDAVEPVHIPYEKIVIFLHGAGANFRDAITRCMYTKGSDPDRMQKLLFWITKLKLEVDSSTKEYAVKSLITTMSKLNTEVFALWKKIPVWEKIFETMVMAWGIPGLDKVFFQQFENCFQLKIEKKIEILKKKKTKLWNEKLDAVLPLVVTALSHNRFAEPLCWLIASYSLEFDIEFDLKIANKDNRDGYVSVSVKAQLAMNGAGSPIYTRIMKQTPKEPSSLDNHPTVTVPSSQRPALHS